MIFPVLLANLVGDMDLLLLTCQLIERAFGRPLPADLSTYPPEHVRLALQEHLTQWITQQLHDHPEQLVQTCYRIDLPEDQFHLAMLAQSPPKTLANNILRHMERKAQWRLHYGKS